MNARGLGTTSLRGILLRACFAGWALTFRDGHCARPLSFEGTPVLYYAALFDEGVNSVHAPRPPVPRLSSEGRILAVEGARVNPQWFSVGARRQGAARARLKRRREPWRFQNPPRRKEPRPARGRRGASGSRTRAAGVKMGLALWTSSVLRTP